MANPQQQAPGRNHRKPIQYNIDLINLKHEVQEWYRRQTEPTFQQTDLALFRKSLLERLQETNVVLNKWCETVALVYKYNKHIQEQHNGRYIREFYTASEPNQER